MKVSERMRKILTFLAFVLLVVLVAAQYFLQQELIAVNTQLQSTRSSAKELSRTSESRALAVSAYKALTGDAPEELYQRPENAVQFYSTSFCFLLHPVHCRSTIVNLSNFVVNTCIE